MPHSSGRVRSSFSMVAGLALGVCLYGAGGDRTGLEQFTSVAPGFRGVVFTQLPAGKPRTEFDGARLVLAAPDGGRRVLSEGFDSAADPEVSFDGRRILFAGKRSAGDPWDIFEMEAGGSGVRQITRGLGDCRHPVYQSSIFELDSPQPWQQITFVSGGALYSIKPDGNSVRRLTYNPAGTGEAAMLPDGRLVFANRFNGRVALFGVNLDGTDYAAFSIAEGLKPKRMPCVTSKGLTVFVESDRAQADGAGSLASVRVTRPLHSYKPVPSAPGFVYNWPSPLPDGSILVSRRAAAGAGPAGIYRLDPETGKAALVLEDSGYQDLQAKLVHRRPEPDGRSTVVDEKYATAKFYCLNVNTTEFANPKWLPEGVAKRIRVIEQLAHGTRLLGETDLDEDGSFHLLVPANLPVQFQTVDANGMALRSSAWVWAKNRENRGCIGCHEDSERTPENVFAKALEHPAAEFTLPEARRRTIEFNKDVAPVLAAKCAACHNGKAQPKLAPAKYVDAGRARTSPLVWRIYGRNTARPWDRVPARPAKAQPKIAKMPPAGSPQLTEDERRTIVEWIDFGANGLDSRQEVKR